MVDLTESLSEASSESDDEPQVTEVRPGQGIAPKVGTKRNLPWMDEQMMQQHMQHQQQRQRIEPGTYVR